MSTQGIGQGLAEGVRMGGQFLLAGMQMKQRKDLAQKSLDADLEWKRAWAGLGPSYEDEEQATTQPQATQPPSSLPAVPSSTPVETPGPLGIPTVRFNPGKPVQATPAAPRPAAPATDSPDARALLPMNSMGFLGRPPRMRRQFY